LADINFNVTCLRFATACGWSDRLRLDLVLNDFVAGALVNKKIEILSDGTPWRPLIHVEDMSRAIDWGIHRLKSEVDKFLVLNIGSNEWNLQIKELAYQVQSVVSDTIVFIDPNGQPDKRSYRVDFTKFNTLAPDFQPIYTPKSTIEGLIKGMTAIHFNDSNYRNSQFIRLNVIQRLLNENQIDQDIKRLPK
jgi:nucleoside-diphosphate-sugar epimerase